MQEIGNEKSVVLFRGFGEESETLVGERLCVGNGEEFGCFEVRLANIGGRIRDGRIELREISQKLRCDGAYVGSACEKLTKAVFLHDAVSRQKFSGPYRRERREIAIRVTGRSWDGATCSREDEGERVSEGEELSSCRNKGASGRRTVLCACETECSVDCAR